MKPDKYVLVGKIPMPQPNLYEWGKWMNKDDRLLWQVTLPKSGIKISTIFLGIDHNWINLGHPVLFETMIFGGLHDGYQERYGTYDEAKAGYLRAIDLVKRELEMRRSPWYGLKLFGFFIGIYYLPKIRFKFSLFRMTK